MSTKMVPAAHLEPLHPAFVLLTKRLILIPTPVAIHLPLYRKFYAALHTDVAFCDMAFGHHFPAVQWTDDETCAIIHDRDILRCWVKRGMGDFAIGLKPSSQASDECIGRPGVVQRELTKGLHLIEASDENLFQGFVTNEIDWAGYAGVRDATTTSLPDTVNPSTLPRWQEMVEIRYGVSQAHWGQGVAREAAEALMEWAVLERGVRRFIAETERTNVRSGRVLEKMGFRPSGTDYWQEPSEIEWERWS